MQILIRYQKKGTTKSKKFLVPIHISKEIDSMVIDSKEPKNQQGIEDNRHEGKIDSSTNTHPSTQRKAKKRTLRWAATISGREEMSNGGE